MKTRFVVAAFVVALAGVFVSTSAYSYDAYLGTITSPDGGSFNSSTTATPFLIPEGAPMAIQCDVASCVNVGLDSGTAASCAASSAGVSVSASALFDIPMVNYAQNSKLGVDTIAAIPAVAGAMNCKVTKTITQ